MSRRPSFGALHAKPRTRSALVVPRDFDGLLHPWFRRSVAPCSRSWGSPCFDFRWRSASTARDGSGTLLYGACPSKRFPRLQQLVMSPCLRPSHRWVESQFQLTPCGARLPWTALGLKALLHRRSRCERSTVASRVLPVASLGFSFCRVSGPTRRSWELRAFVVANHDEGFSFTRGDKPLGQQPPLPVVLIDSGRRRHRSEPASRAPRRTPLARDGRRWIAPGHPLCSLLEGRS